MINRFRLKESQTMEVIRTIVLEGEGTEQSPARDVHYYYSKDGILIAVFDPAGITTLKNGVVYRSKISKPEVCVQHQT